MDRITEAPIETKNPWTLGWRWKFSNYELETIFPNMFDQVAQKGSEGSYFKNVVYIVMIQWWLVCTNVSYQIQTHIVDVIHVLARKEIRTLFKKIYTQV
jgi:hypothetical protein